MKTEITVDVDRSRQLGRPRKNKDKAQSILLSLLGIMYSIEIVKKKF